MKKYICSSRLKSRRRTDDKTRDGSRVSPIPHSRIYWLKALLIFSRVVVYSKTAALHKPPPVSTQKREEAGVSNSGKQRLKKETGISRDLQYYFPREGKNHHLKAQATQGSVKSGGGKTHTVLKILYN